MKKKIISHLIILLSILSLVNSCSYVSDMIEGAITNRAGFSIEIEKDNNNIEITWDYTGDTTAFVGYEVYISKDVNDEFSGYTLVASRYYQDINNNLKEVSTNSYTYDSSLLTEPGEYYFRIGVLSWDKENATDRTEVNGYEIDSSLGIDTEENYNNHSIIKAISGYSMVTIE